MRYYSNSKEGLQDSLNKLSTYCENWKININIKKTQVLVFNKKGIKIDLPFIWVQQNHHVKQHPQSSTQPSTSRQNPQPSSSTHNPRPKKRQREEEYHQTKKPKLDCDNYV